MAELLQVTSLGCSVEAEHSSAPLQPKGQGAGETDVAETMRGAVRAGSTVAITSTDTPGSQGQEAPGALLKG